MAVLATWHPRPYDRRMESERLHLVIDELVAEERARSLWSLREDFLPRTDDERRWVLGEIQKRADRATFACASELKRWLAPAHDP